MYVLLPLSDSGSRRRLPSLGRQYGGFDARTRFLLNLYTNVVGSFFIVIGALRLSTMTFARGSSLSDAELPVRRVGDWEVGFWFARHPMGVSNLFAAYVVGTRRIWAGHPGEVRP
jgi:hypothetical protein